MARSAAFFDLDRTLMAGSSGMAWVKASYEAGLISRTQMLRWAKVGLEFRLRGSTDATTQDAMERIKEVLNGASARELERLGPRVLAEVLPRIYPRMLDEVYSHRDEGRALGEKAQAALEALRKATAASPDEGAVGQQSQALGAVIGEAALLRARVRSEIAAFLTPEQLAEASKLQSQRQARSEQRREQMQQRRQSRRQ